jgi:hypothetical protein
MLPHRRPPSIYRGRRQVIRSGTNALQHNEIGERFGVGATSVLIPFVFVASVAASEAWPLCSEVIVSKERDVIIVVVTQHPTEGRFWTSCFAARDE